MNADDGMRRGRFFTATARAAARETRHRKRAASRMHDGRDVFVIRHGTENLTFGWEIRQYGGIVIQRGEAFHESAAAARAEGETALARLTASTG